jgi:hypothetical protein
MSQPTTHLQEKFIEWLLLPEDKRGAVSSEAEWARRMGVADRTLRRWKSSPKFNEAMERMRAGLPPEPTLAPSQSTSLPTSDANGGDEADYRVVKSALVEGAKQGNPKYLDLYFRTYGKPFVEEEVASRATDLSGMDLDELVARTLVNLNQEAMAECLRNAGWTVERCDGDGPARP